MTEKKQTVQKAFGRFRAVYFESGRTSLPLFLQRSFFSITHVRLFFNDLPRRFL